MPSVTPSRSGQHIVEAVRASTNRPYRRPDREARSDDRRGRLLRTPVSDAMDAAGADHPVRGGRLSGAVGIHDRLRHRLHAARLPEAAEDSRIARRSRRASRPEASPRRRQLRLGSLGFGRQPPWRGSAGLHDRRSRRGAAGRRTSGRSSSPPANHRSRLAGGCSNDGASSSRPTNALVSNRCVPWLLISIARLALGLARASMMPSERPRKTVGGLENDLHVQTRVGRAGLAAARAYIYDATATMAPTLRRPHALESALIGRRGPRVVVADMYQSGGGRAPRPLLPRLLPARFANASAKSAVPGLDPNPPSSDVRPTAPRAPEGEDSSARSGHLALQGRRCTSS